eukprot:349640-Chlamydomonas_euryale.AAC.4
MRRAGQEAHICSSIASCRDAVTPNAAYARHVLLGRISVSGRRQKGVWTGHKLQVTKPLPGQGMGGQNSTPSLPFRGGLQVTSYEDVPWSGHGFGEARARLLAYHNLAQSSSAGQ